MRLRINNEEIQHLLGVPVQRFPKYTTQIMNLANQNAQGTRAKVVGQMSELIQEFPGRTIEEWERWYTQKNSGSIERATEKVHAMIGELREAISKIDKEMVKEWVRDLVVTKTFVGLRCQQAILRKVAQIKNTDCRLSTPEEESRGIDGYIGNSPVSIKPASYKSKSPALPEDIKVALIYYEKEKGGVRVEFEL